MIARSHIYLATYHRSDTGSDRGPMKLERAEKVAVIRHRHSGHAEARYLSSKLRDADRRVEQ